jgi:hypothetical protein
MAFLPQIETGGLTLEPYGSYYYGDELPPVEHGKLDVRHYRLLFGEEMKRAADLGGDAAEILDTTLIFSAWSVCCDMRMSPTLEPLRTVVALPQQADSDVLAQRIDILLVRAQTLLYGAALVGALRAVGFLVIHYLQGYEMRKEISTRVHKLGGELRLRIGRSAALADDGHAHLDLAQRMVLREDGDAQRVCDARTAVAYSGFLFLGAAVACAFEEPWCPFNINRLRREVEEHLPCVRYLPPDQQNVSEVVTAGLSELRKRYQHNSERFAELVAGGRRNDLDVYFSWGGWDEGDKPTPGTDVLYAALRDLREGWKSWPKIV